MIHLAFFQNPDMAEGGLSTTTLTIIIVLVIAIFVIPVMLSIRKIFREAAQTRALLASGEPAQAKILRMWDTGTTLNDNPQVKFLLEVYPADRAAYQTEIKCYVSRLRIPQIQPGNTVAVKIDRQDAAKIALDLA